MTADPPNPTRSPSGHGPVPGRPLDRRRFLVAGALAAVAGACSRGDLGAGPTGDGPTAPAPEPAPGSTAAGERDPTTSVPPTSSTADAEVTALGPADFEDLPSCPASPESTAGPFPLDEQLVRADITEGYPGHRLRLGLRVLDGQCLPVAGAAVEIWHTDASGDYSAFADAGSGKDEGPGTTFMRGTQQVNDDGIAEFTTIYPGWYEGRTPHIHVRVRMPDAVTFTSQLYFPDDYTAVVYQEAPYAEFGPADTTNATDRLAGDVATNGLLLRVDPSPTGGSRALANLAIGG